MKFHQYLTEQKADSMAKERMPRLILALEAAIIQKTDKLPSSAPIVKQMIGSLNTIKYLLRNKLKLTGREAVSEFAQACQSHFTHDFPPLSTLVKKYKLKVDPIRGRVIVDVIGEGLAIHKGASIDTITNYLIKQGMNKSVAMKKAKTIHSKLGKKGFSSIEEAQVRNLTMSVPKDFMAKQRFNASIRNRINKDIHKILKPTYFKAIPLKAIMDSMGKHGVTLLDDDYTEWSGFFTGGVKDTQMVHFLLGWKDTRDEKGMHRVIPNAAFTMSYFKMPSGKYEVIGYV